MASLEPEDFFSSDILDFLDDYLVQNMGRDEHNGAGGGAKQLQVEGEGGGAVQHHRFAPPVSAEQVSQARKAAIPKKTQLDTIYCTKVWHEWRNYRNSLDYSSHDIVPEDFNKISMSKLTFWLSCFVLEVRNQDGEEYPPNTLHHIYCGIMRYLRQNGQPDIDFFKDPEFAEFKSTLDAEMKRLQSKGAGSK